MKNLRLIGIPVFVILMGWLVFDLTFLTEPRYEGRTLTQWLEAEPNATLTLTQLTKFR